MNRYVAARSPQAPAHHLGGQRRSLVRSAVPCRRQQNGDVAALTVESLRDLLADGDRARVSLDGERADETYVLEHRGRGWLVFFLERGRKRDFRKHSTEAEACRDLLRRLGR